MDSSNFLWLPANLAHSQGAKSTVYDNLAFFPNERVLAQACQNLQISASDRQNLKNETWVAPRSALLVELLDRFFFEQVISADSPKAFLYENVIEEALKIVLRKNVRKPSEMMAQLDDPGFSRALQFIESNLFAKLDVHAIAVSARVSVATLFRVFQREIDATPFDYIRTRRLDEAKALLKTGDYTVSDVAILVGYEDLSAFSKSFKAQFGQAPKFFKS